MRLKWIKLLVLVHGLNAAVYLMLHQASKGKDHHGNSSHGEISQDIPFLVDFRLRQGNTSWLFGSDEVSHGHLSQISSSDS